LERPRLGPRRQGPRRPARIQSLLPRRALRGRLRAGAAGPGTELAGAAADQRGHLHDPAAVPDPGETGESPGPAQLALPAGPLPCLLRRLRATTPDLRDGAGRASAR